MVQNLAEIQHQQNMKRDKYNFIFLFFVYEKTKNLFHTKFTKKITFGNNIKLKYSAITKIVGINMKNMVK